MKCQIVIGLGFGDEAKGQVTHHLCRQADRPLVVRFSGGHQAGHTVVTKDGKRHVFSNFGAGSFTGAPTFWSSYCSFHPIGYANELAALQELGLSPSLFVDGKTAVTTPYDLLYNRKREKQERHGSCGLGFGATVARQEGPHKIHVQDLLDDFVLDQKMASVAAYYSQQLALDDTAEELEQWLISFYEAVEIVRRNLPIVNERAFFASARKQYDLLVFEGSQGLLLDQEFGYFPHVTRAHVSSKNALEIIRRLNLAALEYCGDRPTQAGGAFSGQVTSRPGPAEAQIHYISRAYQTRHGNGPLSNEGLAGLDLAPTPYETNRYNEWQGEQRRSLLDVDQLRYALRCDAHYTAGLDRFLHISCRDQINGRWRATDQGEIISLDNVDTLAKRIGGKWAGKRISQLPINVKRIHTTNPLKASDIQLSNNKKPNGKRKNKRHRRCGSTR